MTKSTATQMIDLLDAAALTTFRSDMSSEDKIAAMTVIFAAREGAVELRRIEDAKEATRKAHTARKWDRQVWG